MKYFLLASMMYLSMNLLTASQGKEGIYTKDKKNNETTRNFYAGVSKEEKKDIYFIITTLANKSLASLLTYKSSLEAAGNRIHHIHPLQFLQCIFLDEELKVGIRNIHTRGGWVWKDFLEGFQGSFQEESKKNNVTEGQILSFCKVIGVDSQQISYLAKENRWNDLVIALIKMVPRKGDTNRYDM